MEGDRRVQGGYGGREKGKYGRRRDRDHMPRGRGGYNNEDYNGPMKTPVILKPSDKRQQEPPLQPGSISIIQREPSGGTLPSSPHVPVLSPVDHHQHQMHFPSSTPSPSSSFLPQGHLSGGRGVGKDDGRRLPRRSEGSGGSGPSAYTPLHPSTSTSSTSRAIRELGGVKGRVDHSVFAPQCSEMTHSIKLVDRTLHWDDQGMESLLEQADFLVVGVVGRVGVGKSTVMSLLAGTRTGSGKPSVFRTQSKEVCESGVSQTTGIDMLVTGERVILLDTQAVLSGADSHEEDPAPQPLNGSVESPLDLKLGAFLYSVCHLVVVVLDGLDAADPLFSYLRRVEQCHHSMCAYSTAEYTPEVPGESSHDFYPQLVCVLNHASPADFLPQELKLSHLQLLDTFQDSKATITGGISLFRSQVVPIGRGFPIKKPLGATLRDPADVNFHLLPSNPSISETHSIHCTSRPGKQEVGLNPILSLLPSYTGHPSFQLLSETLRNQVFEMPRPPMRQTPQQQFTEREWFEHARQTWLALRKTNLSELCRLQSPTQ